MWFQKKKSETVSFVMTNLIWLFFYLIMHCRIELMLVEWPRISGKNLFNQQLKWKILFLKVERVSEKKLKIKITKGHYTKRQMLSF